jgi:hypothetical protein
VQANQIRQVDLGRQICRGGGAGCGAEADEAFQTIFRYERALRLKIGCGGTWVNCATPPTVWCL